MLPAPVAGLMLVIGQRDPFASNSFCTFFFTEKTIFVSIFAYPSISQELQFDVLLTVSQYRTALNLHISTFCYSYVLFFYDNTYNLFTTLLVVLSSKSLIYTVHQYY